MKRILLLMTVLLALCSIANADIFEGGTPSASTTWYGTPASAFDDDNGTMWGVALVPGILYYDLGSGNEIACYEYTVRFQYVGPIDNTVYAPKTWTFDGSNDLTNWDNLDTQASETGWSNGETRTYNSFTNGTNYRYYRWSITVSNHAGGSMALVEISGLGVVAPSPSQCIVTTED